MAAAVVHACALAAVLCLLTACSASPAQLPAEQARAKFVETCERRLRDRTRLTPQQIGNFCPCFANEAAARHDMNRLNAEMDSGSDEVFKSTLRSEFDRCKARM